MTTLPKARKTKRKASPGKECDRLFSLVVRSVGYCESGRPDHAGPLQCSHRFSRRYRTVRWDRRNADCFCAGCHLFFTHHPLEFDEWMYQKWGTVQYLRMRELALRGPKPDVKAILERLHAEVKELA